jgi:alpha-tubulin suppressor-like RCC1 family protein
LLTRFEEVTSENVSQYASLHAYIEKQGTVFEGLEEIKQIAANQTTFTALSVNGTVYTWGDGRYEACLGREITDER